MNGFKDDKKLGFDDIIDINFDKNFKLSIIQPFQNIKTPNVERLNKIRWMYKEIEDDNVFIFIKFLELDWKIAFIAI